MKLGIFQHKIGKIHHFLPLGIRMIFGPNLRGVTALLSEHQINMSIPQLGLVIKIKDTKPEFRDQELVVTCIYAKKCSKTNLATLC